jgi:prepilin-type processing-associated H-X9-DG protein
VVIAIIAILAAILFPVFAKARDKARQTACISNMKQIVLAQMQYAQDYDEIFPLNAAEFAGQTFIYDYTWVRAVQPYVKNLDVFVCPNGASIQLGSWDFAPSNDVTKSGDARSTGRPRGGPVVSYGMTSRSRYWSGVVDVGDAAYNREEYTGVTALYDGIGGYAAGPGSPAICGGPRYAAPSLGLAGIARPADTILLQESNRYDNGGCSGFVGYPRTRHMTDRVATSPIFGDKIGLGFASVAFVDGHVKALRGEQIYETMMVGNLRVYRYFYPAQ